MKEAPPSALAPWRERLIASNVFMRYDYAWKEVEFRQAAHRITGIGCRLLYQYAVWMEAYNHTLKSGVLKPRNKVFIEGNGFPAFQEQLIKACELMGFDIVSTLTEADLVFLYVAPPGDQDSECNQYKSFQVVVEHAKTLPANDKPMFCLLLGDAEFLPRPKTEEAEHRRSLSDFAISQELSSIAKKADYGSVAQFAVEFVPASTKNLSNEYKEDKSRKLDSLMSRFGCVGQNLMHHTEKWEFYAPCESVFCHEENDPNGVTHPSEEDTMFWLKMTNGTTCDNCHAPSTNLAKCSKCRDVMYCSRACQKAAWKLHKRLCVKTVQDEIGLNEEAMTS
ncbi:putative Zinc finger, MYND-type [Plasmopara halstedii]